MIKDEDEKPPPLAGAFANIKVFLVSFPVKSRLKLCAKNLSINIASLEHCKDIF